jgi:hypothetical protein
MATGEIEMRERGGDTWHALQTKLEGSRLVGYVDDERFRSGAYESRRQRGVHKPSSQRRTGHD